MAKTARLIISDRKKFDQEVWNTNSDFSTKEEYQQWLETAKERLSKIYNGLTTDDSVNPDIDVTESDVYFLGDVINILGTIEVSFKSK